MFLQGTRQLQGRNAEGQQHTRRGAENLREGEGAKRDGREWVGGRKWDRRVWKEKRESREDKQIVQPIYGPART